jgi:tRNA A58 N-methylase Trm61
MTKESLIICNTAGVNRSISTEVGTGSGSLSALSVSAGKSATHSMLKKY